MKVEFEDNAQLRFTVKNGVHLRHLGAETIAFDEEHLLFVRLSTSTTIQNGNDGKLSRTLPLMAGLKLTDHCNLACTYCFAEITSQPSPSISIQDFEFAVRCLRAVGIMAITLTGGEPTTCEHLLQYLRVARSDGMVVFLETNGIKLLKHNLSAVKDTGCHIRVSLDSVDPKVCVRLRVGRPSDVVRSIEGCAEAGVSFAVRSVVTQGSLSGLTDILRTIGPLGVKLWILRRAVLVPGRIGPYAEPADQCEEEETVRGLRADAAERFPELQIKYRTKSTYGANIVLTMSSIPALRRLEPTLPRASIWKVIAPERFSLERHQTKYLSEGEEERALTSGETRQNAV